MLIWVQTADFVGRCRRAAQRGFRLNERRKQQLGEALPALPTLLRQLSLYDLSAPTPESLSYFRTRLEAAIALANTQDQTACEVVLAELLPLLDTPPQSGALQPEVASALGRASTTLT
jgi:hypothetical protein